MNEDELPGGRPANTDGARDETQPDLAGQLDPVAVAEDDKLRSDYVRQMVAGIEPDSPALGSASIPRLVVQFWDKNEGAPPDVRECLDSWVPIEEFGFDRILFNDVTAERFISENLSERHHAAFRRCNHPAMRADYFRLCFLLCRGGFYVDADDVYLGGSPEKWFLDDRIKFQPLCYEIATDSMVSSVEFLGKPSDSSGLIYYVNNNPIITPANHPIIAIALERSTRRLSSWSDMSRDIQSITGPGNLTASLVQHALSREQTSASSDFVLLSDWDSFAQSRWPLDYRGDERNWRRWVSSRP